MLTRLEKQRLLNTASELAKAIQTLGAHVEETRTPAEGSVYLKVRSRHSPAGIILCRVRVSFHPATERARSQALFQVVNHEGADVTLETWADILPRVASLLHVSGAKEEAESERCKALSWWRAGQTHLKKSIE